MTAYTLPNYFFDRKYYGVNWQLIKYPEELMDSIQSMIDKGKSLAPDPLTMLSLEVGYISKLQLETGDFQLSTSKMLHNLLGYDPNTVYVFTNEAEGVSNFDMFTTMGVNTLSKEIFRMLQNDDPSPTFRTNDILDWKKVLHQMKWHNYQIDIGFKVMLRLDSTYRETVKEAINQASYRHNMMNIFQDHITTEMMGKTTKVGNWWLSPDKEAINDVIISMKSNRGNKYKEKKEDPFGKWMREGIKYE